MTVQEWLGEENTLGIDIWERKYRYNNESFDEWLDRVSGGNEKLRELIKEKKFLFGGRTLANRGTSKKGSFSNCYSRGFVNDDLNDLMQANSDIAITFKAQGGQGISLSKLRPKGCGINNGQFESDGIIPFMEIYNRTTESISQGGSRKGALIMTLDAWHKEAENFIKIKSEEGKIQKANLSLEIDDEFMECVKKYYETGEVITKHISNNYNGNVVEYDVVPIELYKLMMEKAYDWAEPGCIFTDRFRNYNMMELCDDYQIETCNPCFSGEEELLTVDGYKKFKDLEGTEPFIYNANGDIVKSKVWCSGEKDTVKVNLANNKTIICTPDHKFMLANGDECKAADLSGKRIMLTKDNKELSDSVYVYSVTPHEKMKVYDFAEPTIHWGIVDDCVVHNCGEQPLPKHGACNLGSINLSEFVINPFTTNSYFDSEDFIRAVKIAIEALDTVLDENMGNHALKEQRDMAFNYRNVGCGIMGMHDMLIKLGITYGSKESKDFIDSLMSIMFKASVIKSSELAKEKGAFPKYSNKLLSSHIIKNHFDEHELVTLGIYQNGLRNCSLLSIAPSGSIGTMLNISTGCEPLFQISYKRKTESLKGEDHYYDVYAGVANEYFNIVGKNKLPKYFNTSADIQWRDRVDMQAALQEHVDTAISSTINLPYECSLEEIEKLYLYAWEKGLKGVTIFRDGCKRTGILTTDEPNNNKSDNKETLQKLERGMIIKADDNCVGRKRSLRTGCGTLHCEAFFDSDTGDLLETYFSKGSSGGCANFMCGLSRMISLAARGGVDVYSIVDQLKSSGTCPSYAVRTATKHDTSKGSSCPVAIGNALIEMYEEMQKELNEESCDESDESTTISDEKSNSKQQTKPMKAVKCPSCGGTLVFEGGCNTCKDCGWSKCE